MTPWLAALALVVVAPPADSGSVRAASRAYRAAHESEILREFAALVSIPNLASNREDIARNAHAIALMLEQRGFDTRMLDAEGSPPAVYAALTTPGATRTLALYAHYDGQPVDASQWASPPWTPVLRDAPLEDGGKEIPLASIPRPSSGEWRLYGRSTSDDKAPIVGVLAALDALRAAHIPLAVNLKLFFEGEEEAGSPHLAAILRKHAETLKADLWLLCDGPVHQSRKMQVFFGVRGVTDVEMTLYGPARALHSGHYGNWAPNPAVVLAHLVTGLRDMDGRIRVAGFYDDVRPPSEAERRALATVPDTDAALRASLGLAESEAQGARLVERILLPALNIRGIAAGHVAEKAANAIPTEARVSIDFRLVPDQTPEGVREKVEAHLAQQGFFVVHETPEMDVRRAHPKVVKLRWGPGYPPARTAMDLPVSREVVRAVAKGVDSGVVTLPSLGGSVPMYLFADILKAPVVGVPIANHDNNQHAANENLRLQNLWDGIDVYAALLARFGSAP